MVVGSGTGETRGSVESTTVAYAVSVIPSRHEIQVSVSIDGLGTDGALVVASPTWVPGDYSFAPLGRDLFDVRASDAHGAPLPLRREGWQGYRVEGVSGPVLIEYAANCFAWDVSDSSGILGDEVGVLTGARYLYVPGFEGPVSVSYELPAGWAIHHPSGARQISEWAWEYASYEILLDTPVALGAFELVTREVRGTQFHHLFLDSPLGLQAGADAFIEKVDTVAAGYHDIFGSFPFEDYTFVCATNPLASWGLEHLSSTMVGLDPSLFTDEGQNDVAVRVCAHELFHAWNVRRLRPAPLGDLDFQRGCFSEGLWVAEGFTRYYEFLSCTRIGIYTPEQFLSCVVNYFRYLAVLPAYERVSPVDASLGSWLNHDTKFAGRVNDTIDYYNAGMVIAFNADALLRSEVPGSSLDKAFAAFYARFANQPPGYTPEDLRDFFQSIHAGLGEQVYGEATERNAIGLIAQLERLGFTVEMESVPYIGLVLEGDTGPRIYGVLDTSPAGQSGIAPEDVITAVAGQQFELQALKWSIANAPSVALSVMRGNQTRTFEIPVVQRTQIGKLTWAGSEQQAARIASWTGQGFAPSPGQEIPLDFYENFHGIETVL